MTDPHKHESQDITEVEHLRREVERLSLLASQDQGLLDAILEQSPFGIIISDAGGKLIAQNRAAEAIWAGSATADDIEGWRAYRAFHADGRPYEPQDWALATALRDRVTVPPREIRILRFDDTEGVVLGTATPLFRADGELHGALAFFADLTPTKRAESGLAANHALARVLAERPPDAELMPRVLAELGPALGWRVASYWEVQDTELAQTAVWEADRTRTSDFVASGARHRFARGEGLPGSVWQTAEPAWVVNVQHSGDFPRREVASAAGLRGAFAFPVVIDDAVVGVFDFYSDAAQPPNEDLLRAMRLIGRQLGQFVEKTRAEAAVARSEALKGAILAAAPDAIITMNRGGAILEFNPAAERLLGYSRDSVIGRDMATLIVPERHRAAHASGLARYLAGGEAHILGRRVEIEAQHADGHEIAVEVAITEVVSGAERLFTGYLSDVSERRRREQRDEFLLEASRELASSLDFEATLKRVARLAVPALADWCVVHLVDVDGDEELRQIEVAHTDPEMERLALELQQKYPPDPEDPGGAFGVVRTGQTILMPDIAPELLDAAAQDADHREFLHALDLRSYLVAPLKTGERTIGAISLVGTSQRRPYDHEDVAALEELGRRAAVAIENARLFHERETLIGALEQSNHELDDFAHVISHDLKAPLRGIGGLASWLEEDLGDTLSGESRQHLTLIRSRVDRLATLIDGVLEFARAGRGKHPPELLALEGLIQECVGMIAAPPAVEVIIDKPLPMVMGFRVPVQQVVMNLLTNAVKHGARADGPSKIWVGATSEGSEWTLRVRDEGPGIPAKQQSRIWKVFHTLAPRQDTESSGIGLSVVQKLALKYGGRAWVESEEGKGATFYVTWPQGRARASASQSR